MMFILSHTPLKGLDLADELVDPAAGALVTFEGWVRDHSEGRQVQRLEYQAYPEMALKEGAKILAEAGEKFEILGGKCVHRVGPLEIGDMAVWVGATAAHRKQAFLACEYIIDQIKLRVPIWKKEYYMNGDSGWVNAPMSLTDRPAP